MNIRELVDSKTYSKFEIFGSYFVNFYFNTVYNIIKRSMEIANPNVAINDAYRKFLSDYSTSIQNENTFSKLVKEIHEYYQRESHFCSLIDLESEFLSTFMPATEVNILSASERLSWICKILSMFITKFSLSLSNKYLQIILNDRTSANARIIQDEANHMFYIIREDILNVIAKNKYQKTDKVSMSVVNKISDSYKQLKEQIAPMVAEHNKLKSECDGLRLEMSTMQATHNKKVQELIQEKTALTHRILELETTPTNTRGGKKMVVRAPIVVAPVVPKVVEPIVAPIYSQVQDDVDLATESDEMSAEEEAAKMNSARMNRGRK